MIRGHAMIEKDGVASTLVNAMHDPLSSRLEIAFGSTFARR
jgi:hypothetical protein